METASRTVEDGGTGPFTAIMVGDSTLSTHTIFRPKDLSAFGEKEKLPIIAWGNGGCADSPQGHINFLSEIASHGFLVVAIGPMQQAGPGRGGAGPRGGAPGARGGRGARGAAGAIGGSGDGESSQLLDAIDWAIAQNADKTSQYYNKIDTNKIAVSGMSCGGLQALAVAPDPRVMTAMICNSGIIGNGRGMAGMPNLTKSHLEKLHAPIIYILGGETDIAYANGMDDFRKINNVPAFTANLTGVGHGGTYTRPHGGEFSIVATAWLQWQLKDDKEAAKMFEGDPCGLSKRQGWAVEKKKIP